MDTILVPPSNYLAHCRSAEVDWPSINDELRWFPQDFANGPVHDLGEAGVLSRKKNGSKALGADRLNGSRTVVWEGFSAEWCSLASTFASMCLPSQVDPKVSVPLLLRGASLRSTRLTQTLKANGICPLYYHTVK